jgi:hypothetical protein
MLTKVSKVVAIFILGSLAHVEAANAQEFVIDDKEAEINSVSD